MLLVYIDDIMIVSHLGDELSRQISGFYMIQERIQGPPKRYIGADTEKMQTDDGLEIWTTSSDSYINTYIKTVEGLLLEYSKCEIIKSNARKPFPSNYSLDLDVLEKLGP